MAFIKCVVCNSVISDLDFPNNIEFTILNDFYGVNEEAEIQEMITQKIKEVESNDDIEYSEIIDDVVEKYGRQVWQCPHCKSLHFWDGNTVTEIFKPYNQIEDEHLE